MLTIAWLEGAELGNGVTVVVDCYDVDLTIPHCHNSDINECYCVLEFF